MKNLAAFTVVGSNYPPFISINECEGHIEVTVRNHPRDNQCGDTATIKLTEEQFVLLVRDINHALNGWK